MINKVVNSFQPISLTEMSEVKLMNRIDTKFVVTLPKLIQLLQLLGEDYYAQEVNNKRNQLYSSTYLDTINYDMYKAHQNGHANRQKLRFRIYESTNLQFMEVKTKNNHGRTQKKRIAVTDTELLERGKAQFLHQHLRYEIDSLKPTLRNQFYRITLVNKAKTERLTIDTNLRFLNLVSGWKLDVSDLAIIELKRERLCFSPILEKLRLLRIHPHSFSKYCIGSALTNEALRVNRFKREILEINIIRKDA